MLSPKKLPTNLTYRQFTISFDPDATTTLVIVRWEHTPTGSVGLQMVDRSHWSLAEIIRLGMEGVDLIWQQWDRIDFQPLRQGWQLN